MNFRIFVFKGKAAYAKIDDKTEEATINFKTSPFSTDCIQTILGSPVRKFLRKKLNNSIFV